MAVPTDHITYALQPFQFLFLISTSSASLSPKDIISNSVWYRFYLVLLCTFPTSLMIYISLHLENFDISPFNLNCMFIYYLILHLSLIINPLVYAKKQKIRKIIRAMKELDFKLRFNNFKLSEKSRRNVIIWITFVITFHILIHITFGYLIMLQNFDYYAIASTFWLRIIEMAIDLEMLCLATFARLLCYRADFFISHLNAIIEKRIEESDQNLLMCHRQLHYVLKKINKAWKIQLTTIVYFVILLTLRNLLLIFLHLNDNIMVCVGVILVLRYALLLILLGTIGQRVANTFDKIHLLATTMRDSSCINSVMVRSGANMSLEGELRVRRLCGMNGLQVDAKLPLRVLSTIGTILVFILQLRFDTTGV